MGPVWKFTKILRGHLRPAWRTKSGCPRLERPSRALSAPTAAAYGSVVPVVLGGVYVIAPEVVRDVGHGSLEKGERVLDLFVKRVRKETQRQRQSAI